MFRNWREARSSARQRFLVTFLLFLAVLVLWSLAVPMFGPADENEHMAASYGVVHGQGRGQADSITGAPSYVAPHVFDVGNLLSFWPCWVGRAQSSAACGLPSFRGPDVSVYSRTSSYPPYYYALVGWPTLVASGQWSLYLMRFVSAAFVALLMALAVDTLAKVISPAPLLLALGVALVPTAYFFGGSVNPSGLAIAATLAAWTGGILLARGEPVNGPSSVARFAGPVCVLLLLRRDSLYWALLVILALVALTPWSRIRELARRRAMWVGLGAIGVSALVSFLSGGGAAWAATGSTSSGSFWGAVHQVPTSLQQIVGVLGWGESYLPFPVYTLVEAMVAFLVIAACFFGPRRLAAVTAAIAAAVFLVPVAIGTVRLGYFQGRYEVGFAAGLLLVAALAIGEQLDARGLTWPRRAQVMGLAILVFVQLASFAQILRRYSAGADGQWWIFAKPQWTPPYLSLTGLTLLFAVAVVALYGWLYCQSWPSRLHEAGPGSDLDDILADRVVTAPATAGASDDAALLVELERWGLKGAAEPEPPSGGGSTG